MISDTGKSSSNHRFKLGSIVTAAMIALGSPPVAAQDNTSRDGVAQNAVKPDTLKHDTGAQLDQIDASHLYETCILIADFSEGVMPDDYDDVAIASGWEGILKAFNTEDVQFLALCFGNQPNRAHVWLETPSENGDFVASGPQFPPNWTIGDDGTLCLGTLGSMSCVTLFKHHGSGLLYLSDPTSEDETLETEDEKGGEYWVMLQEEDGTSLFADIEHHLDGRLAE